MLTVLGFTALAGAGAGLRFLATDRWPGGHRGTLVVNVVGSLALGLLATVTLLTKSHARSSSTLHRSQMRWLLWGLLALVVTLFLPGGVVSLWRRIRTFREQSARRAEETPAADGSNA